MSSHAYPPRVHHRQSMLFGWKALFARADAVLPPPRTPDASEIEPWLVALLVLAPPVGVIAWWRRYRENRR
jgi:hypothetical protein